MMLSLKHQLHNSWGQPYALYMEAPVGQKALFLPKMTLNIDIMLKSSQFGHAPVGNT